MPRQPVWLLVDVSKAYIQNKLPLEVSMLTFPVYQVSGISEQIGKTFQIIYAFQPIF